MKKLIYSTAIVSALLLGACEDDTDVVTEEPTTDVVIEEPTTDVVTEEPTTDAVIEEPMTEVITEEPANEDMADVVATPSEKINQVIGDDEHAKITLISVKEVTDATDGRVYEILFEVENRLSYIPRYIHGDVSVNGEKVPHSVWRTGMGFDEIQPGTTGHVTLYIYLDREPKISELNSTDMILAINTQEGKYVSHYKLDLTF